MNFFLEVIKADYLGDYRLCILFNNGEERIVDLQKSLNGEIFQPLKDKEYFKRYHIHFNTLEWENGADFAPEYLYEQGVRPYNTDSERLQTAAEV